MINKINDFIDWIVKNGHFISIYGTKYIQLDNPEPFHPDLKTLLIRYKEEKIKETLEK